MATALIKKVTIANGASLSGVTGDMGGYVLKDIELPATMQGTSLTFVAGSDTQANAAALQSMRAKDGSEYTVTCAQGQYINLPASDFAGVRNLAVRTGAAGAPQNQSQSTVIKLIFVPWTG